jgi:hypothetical protein
MSGDEAIQFLRGALAALSWVAALFFHRFWKTTGDRLFVYFVVAFSVLTLHWVWLSIADPPVETRHYVLAIRALAFVTIIVGILDKNRAGKTA